MFDSIMSNRTTTGQETDYSYECSQCGCSFDPETTNFRYVDDGDKVVCGDDCEYEYKAAHALEELCETVDNCRKTLRNWMGLDNQPEQLQVIEPVDLDVCDFTECELT